MNNYTSDRYHDGGESYRLPFNDLIKQAQRQWDYNPTNPVEAIESQRWINREASHMMRAANNDPRHRAYELLDGVPDLPGLYAYTYPMYYDTDKNATIALKIGSSSTGVKSRLIAQWADAQRTVLPEDPIVIQTWTLPDCRQNCIDYEQQLRFLAGSRIAGRLNGKEWITTTRTILNKAVNELRLNTQYERPNDQPTPTLPAPHWTEPYHGLTLADIN